MKRRLSVMFCMVFLVSLVAVFPQGVDKDEFSGILDKVINFQSYQGKYQKIDTLEAILGIGRALAAGVVKDRDSTGRYGETYRVLHIVGTPEEKGKPADIIEFLPAAGVDHIDNVRRIVSSYLSSAYQYTRADADLLAFYITIYNAVYRGNMDFFANRFKPSVMKVLSPQKVGLAISYLEWAGKTQLLIPLGVGVASVGTDNQLSAINTAELVGPQVLEMVRDTPDKSTDKRTDMANLMDRTIDQEQSAIDAEKARLAKEKEDLLKKTPPKATEAPAATPQPQKDAPPAKDSVPAKDTKEVAKTDPAASNTADKTAAAKPADTAAPQNTAPDSSTNTAAAGTPTAPDTAKTPDTGTAPANTAEAAKTDDQKKLEDIAKKEAELKQREEQIKQLDDAARALRENTALDLAKDVVNALLSENLLYLLTRLDGGLVVSSLQRINSGSGVLLAEGKDFELLNRQVQEFAGALLCLVRNGDTATLALVDATTLQLAKKGTAVISPWSQVVILPGGKEILAVMQNEGAWYLGRFDASLNPTARSVIAVDPLGVIQVQSKTIMVQRQDGRASILDITDLRTAR